MKLVTAFPIIALLSAAPSATATVRRRGKDGGRGGGRGKPRGKGGGGDKTRGQTATRNLSIEETLDIRTVIVRIKKDREHDAAALASLASACADMARAAHGTVAAVYDAVLHGCAIELSSHPMAASAAAMAATMAADPRVLAAEEDQRVHAAYSWGLDRVDQCELPLGGALTQVDATGVRVYVLDTGVDANHDEFAGVLDRDSACHANTAADGTGPFDDISGHGTHVAGTACGANYGVARGCDLCAVRVLDATGSGSWSAVIAGINHAVLDCAAAFPTAPRRCVANMSLGGPSSASVDAAVADAADAGVTMVVAAGNDNDDACDYSPAAVPRAITVGATTRADNAATFSNWGPCVDVYAPGDDIVSARAGSGSGTETLSGTSMASPHVAGIAAGLLREDAAADVAARLLARVQVLPGQAQDGSVVLLANAVEGGCGGVPPPAPTAAPIPCTQSLVTVVVETDDYPGETSWDLADECGGGGGPERLTGYYTNPRRVYEDEHCLPASRYTFTIRDLYSDGLCCSYGDGSYKVLVDGVTQFVGGAFNDERVYVFGSCDPSSTQDPTPAPTPPPVTSSPVQMPVPSPTPCPQTVIKVEMLLDSYGYETTWDLVNQCDASPVGSGGPYSATEEEVEEEFCRPAAQYKFTVRDLYGDGICCDYGSGKYEVLVDGVSQFVGGAFGSLEEHVFGSCEPLATSPPTPPPPATTPPTTPPPTPPPPSITPPTPPITSRPTSRPAKSKAGKGKVAAKAKAKSGKGRRENLDRNPFG